MVAGEVETGLPEYSLDSPRASIVLYPVPPFHIPLRPCLFAGPDDTLDFVAFYAAVSRYRRQGGATLYHRPPLKSKRKTPSSWIISRTPVPPLLRWLDRTNLYNGGKKRTLDVCPRSCTI